MSKKTTIISNKINRISGDLLYVIDCLRLNDDGTNNYADVEKPWLSFSNRKTLYDQCLIMIPKGNKKA